MGSLMRGGVSGGLGTLALNATTFLDMALRGRPPSDVPERAVGAQARRAGVSLGDEPAARHRRAGIGALSGYATGIAFGAAYGLVRGRSKQPSVPLTGAVLGAVAMVGANAPAVSMGITDPRRWGVSGWLEDVVPHLVFGLVTAAVFHRLQETTPGDEGSR